MVLATTSLSCPSARPDGLRRVILVVDDDPVVRDLVATLLETEGYEAVVAGDGLEALTKLNGPRPALILLDLMMPRLDGFQFAEELKRRGPQAKIPIVVLTASGLAQEAARQIGAQGYIEKPFDFSALLEHVEQLTTA